MSDRKKSDWLFWTTAVLLLPVPYVASFGPACWLSNRSANASMLVVYRPLIRAGTPQMGQPELYRTPLQSFLKWYADLGAENYSTFCHDRIDWTIFDWR